VTTCSCGEGCPTYGACLRRKNLHIGYCQSWRGHDYTADKKNERECDAYRAARAQGIQPGGTTTQAVRYALDQSNWHGRAFNAAKPLAHLPED